VTLILASQSSGRIAMLQSAGVEVEAHPALVDEASIKDSLVASGAKARDIADALAEAKARKVSRKFPTALVLGCDQLLVTADGTLLDKPETRDDAREHLAMLSGSTHRLISAAVICENGAPVWRIVDMSTRIGIISATALAVTGSRPRARSCFPVSAEASLRSSACRCSRCLTI
jgi:septum formation protein